MLIIISMSTNNNAVYQHHQEIFFRLGKSMKNYAIASLISMGVGFIGAIVMQIVFLTPIMTAANSGIFDDPYSLILGYVGILIFYLVITLATGIYQFVTYILYLIQLKKVGEYTNEIDLQKAYKMELWSIIVSIIMVISIPIMLLVFFSGGLMIDFSSEAAVSSFLIILFGIVFVIMLFAITSTILQVLSVLAFDRWGQRIKMANNDNQYCRIIAEGTNFMKLGKIISIFISNIGIILFSIGLIKAGNNIIAYFQGNGNSTSTQGSTVAQSSSGSTLQQPHISSPNPDQNSSYMGSTTMKPQGEGFCPFCGSTLEDKNMVFCGNCGRKML